MSKFSLAILLVCFALWGSLSPLGAQKVQFTVLHRFSGGADAHVGTAADRLSPWAMSLIKGAGVNVGADALRPPL